MTGELSIYENILSTVCFTSLTIILVGVVIFGIIMFIYLIIEEKHKLEKYK